MSGSVIAVIINNSMDGLPSLLHPSFVVVKPGGAHSLTTRHTQLGMAAVDLLAIDKYSSSCSGIQSHQFGISQARGRVPSEHSHSPLVTW